ncbi:hypothetical protein LIER_19966 [Lithospermum erythrorhizon]|uniref:Uncharacterized protein n=1 Tax=Lithospermum erythrorhizon TaxID=34254 RepID=A0AAV3QM20_LITER
MPMTFDIFERAKASNIKNHSTQPPPSTFSTSVTPKSTMGDLTERLKRNLDEFKRLYRSPNLSQETELILKTEIDNNTKILADHLGGKFIPILSWAGNTKLTVDTALPDTQGLTKLVPRLTEPAPMVIM